MEKRFSLTALFLYTVAISVSFLAIYYTVTARYDVGFTHLVNQLHPKRSAIQRQQSPKSPLLPVLRNTISEDNNFVPNKAATHNPHRHPRFSLVKRRKGVSGSAKRYEDFEKSKFLFSSSSASSKNLLTTRAWFERKKHADVSMEEKMESLQENGQMPKNPSTKAEGNYEPQNKKQIQSIQSLIDPHRHYLKRSFTGRLGNVLFEFASAFCIAKLNNLTLVLKDMKELQDLRYRGIRVPEELWSQLSITPIKRHWPGSCCGFNPKMMKLKPTNYNHHLITYFQSWKFFEPCKIEVKSAISFNDAVTSKALSIMAILRKNLPHRTLVGVHVRMEDYLKSVSKENGKKVAPPNFYLRAMTYFRSTFHDVTFIVITSNPKWFRKNVTAASDVMILPRSDLPAVDMEVLSRMDHIIFSVGTFGWWAAYKNNGTVVCFKDFYVPGSKYGRQFWNNATDYFYPGWILM